MLGKEGKERKNKKHSREQEFTQGASCSSDNDNHTSLPSTLYTKKGMGRRFVPVGMDADNILQSQSNEVS